MNQKHLVLLVLVPLLYAQAAGQARVRRPTTPVPTSSTSTGPVLQVDASGITFPDGSRQTTAASGSGSSISSVNAGSGLTGGGSSGTITIAVDSTVVRTNLTNTFSARQVFGGGTSSNPTVYATQSNSTSTFPSLNSPPAAAIRGDATATSNYAAGVLGGSFSPTGYGILGGNYANSGTAIGVVGISGISTLGTGVLGEASATTGDTYGVWGIVYSSAGAAGVFENNGNGDLLRGYNATSLRFRLDGNGNAYLAGQAFTGADFAEAFEVEGSTEEYSPGDVLAIDGKARRRVTLTAEPYSTKVAGVYSTKPGIVGSPLPNVAEASDLSDYVPMAVIGVVDCKVSSENGPIEIGDLLVSSSRPGYAMKGTDRQRMLGAIVGKALQRFEGTTGKIEILVTLQ